MGNRCFCTKKKKHSNTNILTTQSSKNLNNDISSSISEKQKYYQNNKINSHNQIYKQTPLENYDKINDNKIPINPNTEIYFQKINNSNQFPIIDSIQNDKDIPMIDSFEKKNKLNNNSNFMSSQIPNQNYDMQLYCESLEELKESGWNYYVSEQYSKYKDRKIRSIGILGESDKGKTFLLNLLVGTNLKSGINIKTIGISLKYIKLFENEKNDQNDLCLLFDTAGRCEPLLVENRKEETNEELKEKVEKKARDLKMSEKFLRNFILKNAKIIIVVVNQLSLNEQQFLYDLKTEIDKYDQIFVVHNLYHLYTMDDINKYIKETIESSIYFNLKKLNFDKDDDEDMNKNNFFYFVEEINYSGKKKANIIHFLMGNHDNNKDLKDFNEKCINELKNEIYNNPSNVEFDIQKALDKELKEENLVSDKIKIDSRDAKENNMKTFYINGGETINDKNPENEFNGLFLPDFIPNYIYYYDNDYFYIEIECPGEEDRNLRYILKPDKGKINFHFTGSKIFPKFMKKKSKRFHINFIIDPKKEKIEIDDSSPVVTFEKGIYKIKYKLEKQN